MTENAPGQRHLQRPGRPSPPPSSASSAGSRKACPPAGPSPMPSAMPSAGAAPTAAAKTLARGSRWCAWPPTGSSPCPPRATATATAAIQLTDLTALRRRLGQLLGQDALADLDHASTGTSAASGRLSQHEHELFPPDQPRADQQAQPGTSLTTPTNTFPCHAGGGAQVCATRIRRSRPMAHKNIPRKGNESVKTTHIYLAADLALKEQALNRTAPLGGTPGRYQPPDDLLAFLEAL